MTEVATNNTQAVKDRYYRRNVFGISSVEFIWGLGLPVVIESTFLQLFVKSIGGSSFVIGLIPTFFFIGTSGFALFSSYFTRHMVYRRAVVVLLHFISGFSFFIFGLYLYVFGKGDHLLYVFFFSYGIFSLCVGLTLPVWLNYLVDILSEKKSVSGIAFMLIAQNIAKLIGSMVIVKIVDTYSFSIESSALVFIGVGTLLTIGSLFFIITKEVPELDGSNVSNESFVKHTLTSLRHMLKNRNFLTFLAGDFEFFIIVTVVSFYANYATTYCNVDPAIASGFFVACLYLGAISANFFMGTLGYLSIKNKYKLSKLTSTTALLLMILFQYTWIFFISSYLMGISRGSRMVSMAPATKKLSGLPDSTSYFALAPLITLPFASALPMLAGSFLDRNSHLGGDSYRIIFSVGIVLICISFFFIHKTDFSGLEQK